MFKSLSSQFCIIHVLKYKLIVVTIMTCKIVASANYVLYVDDQLIDDDDDDDYDGCEDDDEDDECAPCTIKAFLFLQVIPKSLHTLTKLETKYTRISQISNVKSYNSTKNSLFLSRHRLNSEGVCCLKNISEVCMILLILPQNGTNKTSLSACRRLCCIYTLATKRNTHFQALHIITDVIYKTNIYKIPFKNQVLTVYLFMQIISSVSNLPSKRTFFSVQKMQGFKAETKQMYTRINAFTWHFNRQGGVESMAIEF